MKKPINFLSFVQFLIFLVGSGATHSAALHDAIQKKDTKLAILEIYTGDHDLNEMINGKAAIHLAVENGLADVVLELINRGAKLNLPTASNKFPAQIAYENSNKGLFDLLTKYGGYRGKRALSSHVSSVKFDELFHSDKGRLDFPYLYPLFFSEAEAFIKLRELFRRKKLSTWEISELLGSLAAESFPNGLPSMLARRELEELLTAIDASPQLRERLGDAIQIQIKQIPLSNKEEKMPTLLEWQDRRMRFLKLNKRKLAKALTAREAELLRAITPSQLSIWLADKNVAESVSNFIFFGNQNKIFWCMLIATAPTQEARVAVANELLKLANQLLVLNNFSGVQAIVGAFANATVTKLLTPCTEFKDRLEKLSALIDTKSPKHLQRMRKIGNGPYIPLLGIYLHNMGVYFEDMPTEITSNWLMQIGDHLKFMHHVSERATKFIFRGHERNLGLLSALPPLPEDLVEAFAYVQEPDLFTFARTYFTTRKAMNQCNAEELIKCLEALNLPHSVGLILLRAQIWNGKNLHDFLTQESLKSKQAQLLVSLGIEPEHAEFIRYNFFLNCVFDV